MNKTIIINMNGIIFHIEEDAYEQLKNYMTSVKRHFAYTADSEEIVTDIENRIAEMFSELLGAEKKQVIVLKDVASVIEQMGSVSDFESAEQETFAEPPLRSEKRLYRDDDDRIIGGVCTGVGHYFSIEAKWVRLFFVLTGMIGGSGVFAYIILWIVMPKAKSRAEKMAMKGETLNIQNFKRNFDEEAEAMGRIPVVNRASGFFRDFFGHFASFIAGLAKILLKFICGILIFACLVAVIGVFIFMMVLMGNSSLQSTELLPIISSINPEYRSPLYFSAFVLTIIPLTALILFAIRVLFNHKIITRTGVFAMLVIWLTGLGIGIFYGARVAAGFAEEATFSQVQDLKPAKFYVLELNDSKIFSHDDSVKYALSKDDPASSINGRTEYDDEGQMADMHLYIERSEDGEKPTLTKKFSSRGPNFDTALRYAQHIGYQFTEKDSLLRFGWAGYLDRTILRRDQQVDLTLRIPKNTLLKIDGRLNRYLMDHNLYNCIPEDAPHPGPSNWIMAAEGLKCVNDSVYRANTSDR